MANCKKFKRFAVGHMFNCYNRCSKDDEEQNIEASKTHMNYNLKQSNKSQIDIYHERLSQVKCLNRKDLNTMCCWVVTIPAELKAAQKKVQNDFFKHVYNFLNNRYGEKNCISAYVHFDQTTPHMHYSFIPVVIDKKKNIEKVSAKDLVNLRDLKTFHKDLQNYLQSKMQMPLSIITGETKINGNKTIKELQEESNKLNEEIEILKKEIQSLKEEKTLLLNRQGKI